MAADFCIAVSICSFVGVMSLISAGSWPTEIGSSFRLIAEGEHGEVPRGECPFPLSTLEEMLKINLNYRNLSRKGRITSQPHSSSPQNRRPSCSGRRQCPRDRGQASPPASSQH